MSLIAVCWSQLRAAAGTRMRNERGASIVEYALLLALIAIVCVAAVTLVGTTTSDSFSRSASKLN